MDSIVPALIFIVCTKAARKLYFFQQNSHIFGCFINLTIGAFSQFREKALHIFRNNLNFAITNNFTLQSYETRSRFVKRNKDNNKTCLY